MLLTADVFCHHFHHHCLHFNVTVSTRSTKKRLQWCWWLDQYKKLSSKLSPTEIVPNICHQYRYGQPWTWRYFRLHRCWWLYFGDNFLMLVTSYRFWCLMLMLKARGCCWRKRLKPSPTHLIFNIRHQYRCGQNFKGKNLSVRIPCWNWF